MASPNMAFQVSCIQGRPTSTPSNYFHNFTTKLSSALKPLVRQVKQVGHVSETITSSSAKVLDAFVDSVFQFVDQPLLPSQRAPGTGELVIIGVDAVKPFLQVGVISADGKEMIHKADLKLNRYSLCHDVGVTQRYNVILDFPLVINIMRVVRGGPLIKYDKEGYARIGIMPRYGDANSTSWFEVVVRGCRALNAILPGPNLGLNKFEWFSKGFKPVENVAASEDGSLFSRCYEWRLNMETGQVKERNLTGTEFSIDFPMINAKFTGLKNRFGYTQVVDSIASSILGGQLEEILKVEYNMFEKNTFCSGSAFVPMNCDDGEQEKDDGWIITFVHNEDTNISQVYVIDTKKFTSEPIAKITLPCRVPYGFHGAFMPIISAHN